MAELSNRSYHYKSDLAALDEEDGGDTTRTGSKKKTRRRKRMLTGVSKQRRAANERERKRLQIINHAFKELKSALPLFPTEDNISKIEIVRLASKTIEYLSDMVHDDNIDSMTQTRSPGGSESSGVSTEGSSCSLSDITSDVDTKLLDADNIDISNLLFPTDIKVDGISSDVSSLSSTTDAFNGIDISSFLNADDDTDGSDDVFPSMLYL